MNDKTQQGLSFDLLPVDNARLANLCGQMNEHLHQVEKHFGVKIDFRSNHFNVDGADENAQAAKDVLNDLYKATAEEELSPSGVQLFLTDSSQDVENLTEKNTAITKDLDVVSDHKDDAIKWRIKTRKGYISGRSRNQVDYLKQIKTHDLTLGIGPAGTGKTYLAVACAVDALENDLVDRLVLVRPAVEAGEKLGFLPGDLAQKIDPYLRPMYDALFEMMGQERVAKLIEKNIIEIAPLAYMRGRTLNDAFIILDEAQNTTIDQMKMFLTRIGFGSKAVVTGDITQVDLPREKISGLRHAKFILDGIKGISVAEFSANDVVRHPLVKKIVTAYDKDETT